MTIALRAGAVTPRIPAWAAVTAFGAAIALLLAAGKPELIRLAYPAGALAVGAWLYRLGPAPYVEFSWWLWHISPGLRRIVDYRLGGWDPENPMTLAPFLVSALALLEVARRLPELRRRRMVPWAIAGACVVYGYLVGLLQNGLMPATHALVAWLVPLGFGLYTALQWRRYPECQAAVRRVFLLGSIVLAVYGIWQFVNPAPWDRIWMTSSGMYSVGRAFPYEVRVFSLVNAPLPFATLLVAGLFCIASRPGPSRVLWLALGLVALLLSLVRSVWIAGAAGFLVYLATTPLRDTRRLVVIGVLTLGALAVAPLLAPREIAGPTLEILSDRFRTFTDLSRDVSFRDRTNFLDRVAQAVVDDPLGHGLGSTGVSSTLADPGDGIRDFDNGVFAALYSLGWLGGAGLLVSALLVLGLGFSRMGAGEDPMARAARAVVVTSLLLALGGNVFEGVSAAVLWGFGGLLLASRQWHEAAARGAAEMNLAARSISPREG